MNDAPRDPSCREILAGLRHAADLLRRPGRRRRGHPGGRLAITAAPAILVLPLLATLAGPAAWPAAASPDPHAPVPAVNWALSGQASATSSGSSTPAANAIDGDAGTNWCPSSWTGSLVVDLSQVRSLSDLGITLDAASPSANATIDVASSAGNWQAVPDARNVALDPGNPMYFRLPPGTRARFARLTVFSGTGDPVCVGEFRALGPDPAAAGLALGADLSFTPQELAAGAVFTDRGRQASPVTIMRDNGANYVRMRLWVTRRLATATWPVTWRWPAACTPPG